MKKYTTNRGAALAQEVAEYITDHPDEWDQGSWGCGTTACFGGRALLMTGRAVMNRDHHRGDFLRFADGTYEQTLGFSGVAGDLLELDFRAAYGLFYDSWDAPEGPDGEPNWDLPANEKVKLMWRKLTELYGADKITTPEEYKNLPDRVKNADVRGY